jgi:predicted ribosome quality control (RQC) complex YloA/Tae2 family protein
VNFEEGTSNKSERKDKTKEKNQLESDFERSVKTLDKKLEELNRDIFRLRFHGSLVMARIRED